MKLIIQLMIIIVLTSFVSALTLYPVDPSSIITYVRADQLFKNNSQSTIIINDSFSRLDLQDGNLTNVLCILFEDDTTLCTGDIDTIWNIASSKYLDDYSNTLDVNETVLNVTINEVLAGSTIDTDTYLIWNTTSKYINNDTGVLDIDETELNTSIEAYTDGIESSLSFSDEFIIDGSSMGETNESIYNGDLGIRGTLKVYSNDDLTNNVHIFTKGESINTTMGIFGYNDTNSYTWSMGETQLLSNDFVIYSKYGDIRLLAGSVEDYFKFHTNGSVPSIQAVGGGDIYIIKDSGTWDGIHADYFTEHTSKYEGNLVNARIDLENWIDAKHPYRFMNHRDTEKYEYTSIDKNTIMNDEGTDLGRSGKATAKLVLNLIERIEKLEKEIEVLKK